MRQNPRGARGQRILGEVIGTKRAGVGELDATGQGGRDHRQGPPREGSPVRKEAPIPLLLLSVPCPFCP